MRIIVPLPQAISKKAPFPTAVPLLSYHWARMSPFALDQAMAKLPVEAHATTASVGFVADALLAALERQAGGDEPG